MCQQITQYSTICFGKGGKNAIWHRCEKHELTNPVKKLKSFFHFCQVSEKTEFVAKK